MDQLSPQDAQFLYMEAEGNRTHLTSIGIFDQSTVPNGEVVRFKDILAHIEGRLHMSPLFKRRLVHVPLVVSWPGVVREGLRADGLVELQDQAPTILELAGLPVPETMQGRSLVPILEGRADAGHHREFVRSEYFDALDPVFTGGTGTYATMHRTRKHKLVVYHGKNVGELFDLESDPWEHENLWDHPDNARVKNQLIAESFDAHVLLTTDVGSERIAPM